MQIEGSFIKAAYFHLKKIPKLFFVQYIKRSNLKKQMEYIFKKKRSEK